MRKRLEAVVVILCMFIGVLPTAVASEKNATSWEIDIEQIILCSDLATKEEVTNYDGTKDVIEHHNTPSSGKIFAVVTLSASKKNILADALNISMLTLQIKGENYERMANDVFLINHGYTAFPSDNELLISQRGTVCFEISEQYLKDSTQGWIVSSEMIVSEPYGSGISKLPIAPNIVEQQSEMEQYILSSYETSGQATLENPLIIIDPYGTAPLSALAIFETEDESDITVTIKGKNNASDFTYQISESETHHEVPIIGMYPEYSNQVVIAAENQEKTFTIQTSALPADMADFETSAEESALDNGFTYIAGFYRMLVDKQGQVRWYSSMTTHHDPSGIDQVSASDGIWFSTDQYSTHAQIFHLSWVGKVLHTFSWIEPAHHDAALTDNGEMLYWGGGTIRQIDLSTGESSLYFNPEDVLDSTVDTLEMRRSLGDWLHPNTISFDQGKLYLSFRNQHMLMKMDYQTKEIEWVATPASGKNEQGIYAIQKDITEKIVLPKENDDNFEWFYSQHEIAPLPDLDNNPNTDDFTLFDNGQERGVYGWYDGLTNKKDFYSRIVHYRVDNEKRTIEQIFDWGKDAQPSLSSYYYGGAQYIIGQDTDMYLGCFGMLDFGGGSKIVEVSPTGQVACTWSFPSEYTYRAHFISNKDFSSIAEPALGTAGMAIFEGKETWKTWTSPTDNREIRYKLNDISMQKDGKVTASGWAYMPEVKNQNRETFLVANGLTASYMIKLQTRSGMIPDEEQVPDGYRYGFNDKTIDTTDLPDGRYTLGLQVEAGGQTAYTELPYYFVKGQDNSGTYSTSMPDAAYTTALMRQLDTMSEGKTIDNPYIKMDPYGISPLTALAAFETDAPAHVTVTVQGKDDRTTLTYDIDGKRRLHFIPIVGLYYNDLTNVILQATDDNGKTKTGTISLTTHAAVDGKLPTLSVDTTESDLSQAASGLTFCMPNGDCHPFAVDLNGDVRWYLTKKVGDYGLHQLSNGHFLVESLTRNNVIFSTIGIDEIDLLGRVYRQYNTDGVMHHEAKEIANGNYIFSMSKAGKSTINDYIEEIDPKTGGVVRSWDMQDILGQGLAANETYGTDNYSNWFHNNCVDYLESEDALLISSRHQNMVIKLDAETKQIRWILGDHNTVPEHLQQYLLTPVGEEFEWQYGQHAPMFLPDGNIMLYDNGDYRSKTVAGSVQASQNYSRAVIYHVDENHKTVSQVWQYGKENGSDTYTTYIGDVDYLGSEHYLLNFGGIIRDSNGVATDTMGTGTTTRCRVFEYANGKPIWTLSVDGNADISYNASVYRAERLDVMEMPSDYDCITEQEWLGEFHPTSTVVINTGEYSEISSSDYQLTSVINEGNRLLINGKATAPTELSNMYIGLRGRENTATYKVSPNVSTGEFSSVIYFGNEFLGDRQIDILVDKTDGSRLKCFTGAAIPALKAFAITMDTPNNGVSVGETFALKATATPTYAQASTILYESSNPNVATVSASGVVTAVSAGYVIITARMADSATASQIAITVLGQSSSGNSGGGGGGGAGISRPAEEKPAGSISVSTDPKTGAVTYLKQLDNHFTVSITDESNGNRTILCKNASEQILANISLPKTVDVNSKKSFEDVSSSAWYHDAVAFAVASKLFNGMTETTFGAEQPMTRAMLVTVLHRLSGTPLFNHTGFDDVPSGAWYSQAVEWASVNQIVDGMGNNLFVPNASITREQLATILYRFISVIQVPDISGSSVSAFEDAATISSWSNDAMKWAVENKIMQGSDNKLNPQANASRAEVATMLYRLCEYLKAMDLK